MSARPIHVGPFQAYTPNYQHNDPRHVFSEPQKQTIALDQCKRMALAALPFMSFCTPFKLSLTLAMGTSRTYTCLTQLASTARTGDAKKIAYALLQTTVAGAALAGTFFAHPLGILVSTGHDLTIDIVDLLEHLKNNQDDKAKEKCLNIINSALYLSLFIQGGLPLTIASLAMQILTSLYHAKAEHDKGHDIEAAGHLLMCVARGTQLKQQIGFLQKKLELEETLKNRGQKEAQESVSHKPVETQAEPTDIAEEPKESTQYIQRAPHITVVQKDGVYDFVSGYDKALHKAFDEGNFKLVDALLRSKGDYRLPPLFNAIVRNDKNDISILVDHGADMNALMQEEGRQIECPLTIALCHQEILELLLQKGANPNIKLTENQTPLHYAAKRGLDAVKVQTLINFGAEVDARDVHDRTPLHFGIIYQDIAAALLDNGANLHALAKNNMKPLHYASKKGSLEGLKELTKRGIHLHEFDRGGHNALHQAITSLIDPSERLKLLQWLVDEQNMNVNERTNGRYAETPFRFAVSEATGFSNDFSEYEEEFKILQFLLDKGANINAITHYDDPSLDGTVLDLTKRWHRRCKPVLDWLTQHGAKTKVELDRERSEQIKNRV